MKNKAITSRDIDFAKWYTDIVKAAKLAEYSSVKGCVVLEPNGYAIWEKMQEVLDKKFKELGHTNVYMPLLIPENLMKKESELIEGFAPEVAWVTHGGSKLLEEKLCVRPTSETLFSDYYSKVVSSYRDLPMLYNQWCSVFRWEKETRPFLRSREFLWQEGHTIHASQLDAEEETRRMLEVYKWFHHEYLAVPTIVGKKTEKEKFAGADYTLTNEALMYDGIALQVGTSHYFGQRFSKAYDISFLNKSGEQENAYQTSWGTTTRMIGGLIMVHSDDNGLVLPPKIAPIQVVIIPIFKGEEELKLMLEKCNAIKQELINRNITVKIDDRDNLRSGFKFAEHELKGVPVRLAIGPRDMQNGTIEVARRDTLSKQIMPQEDIANYIENLLVDIQENIYQKALKFRTENTFEVDTYDEFKVQIEKGGFILAHWDGTAETEALIKDETKATIRCIPLNGNMESGKCMVTGKPSKQRVVFAKAY